MIRRVNVIVIDDDADDLECIHKAATALGMGCLPIHYPKGLELATSDRFDSVRLVICDLNLDVLASKDSMFGTVAGALINLKLPHYSPFALVVWTKDAGEVDALGTYLMTRMPKENTPSVIVPLDKVEHGVISGGKINESLLMASLTNAMGTSRGLNALLTWERDVAKAADVSVCNLLRLVRSKGTSNVIDVDDEIDQLLSMIAQKATSTAYASINPRSAATEGLLPLLADELQHLEPNEVRDATWSAALQLAVNKDQSAPDLDRDAMINNAMLNNALLISNESATGADRGSVLKAWHDDPIFKSIFGIDRANVVSQLSIKGSPGVAIKYVQMEGRCDATQQKKGVVLFALAAEIDADIELLELGEGRGKRARSVEVSPVFLRENKRVKLVTNMRYFFTLPRVEATNHTADYRLREPLVNQWAFAWATYAIRPGIVSF